MNLKIEKSIPAPPTRSWSKYPFNQMSPGDSLFARGADGEKLRRACYQWGRRYKREVATRAEKNGIRIWLVK